MQEVTQTSGTLVLDRRKKFFVVPPSPSESYEIIDAERQAHLVAIYGERPYSFTQ